MSDIEQIALRKADRWCVKTRLSMNANKVHKEEKAWQLSVLVPTESATA